MKRQQVPILRDNDLRLARRSDCQEIVIIGITTIRYGIERTGNLGSVCPKAINQPLNHGYVHVDARTSGNISKFEELLIMKKKIVMKQAGFIKLASRTR